MTDLSITLLILVLAVALFVWNRIPVGIVALGVAIALWATGVLTLEQTLAGFGSPTVVLIAALFVVAEGLDASGITTWAGLQIIKHAGDSQTRLLVLTMLVGALLSALITPNGAAAALIPMVVVLAIRLGRPPSQLLLPLAFSAHAGSLLMLTGTPINVLILEAALDANAGNLRFFEFARVGIPLTIGTIAIVALLGPRLLPNRTAKTLPRDLSRLPQTLLRGYMPSDALARLTVRSDSPLVGAAGSAINLQPYESLHVIGVQTSRGQPLADAPLSAGASLIARGPAASIDRFAADNKLDVARETGEGLAKNGLISPEYGVAEVVVAPRSAYIGETVFPGMVTSSGELVLLAVQRLGAELPPGETTIGPGDALLLSGRWDALDEQTRDPNVVRVDAPDAIRRQAVPIGPRTMPALVILAAMVVLLTTGLVPAVIAGLLAAIAMILFGVVTVDQAHRAMSWTTLILVGGMIPLSTAITQSGTADLLARSIVRVVGGGNPTILLLALFVITAILGQVISNTATALILIPISLSVAATASISPLPLLMCVNVASAAALLTPVATPANMMVMKPGGYQFGDYLKFGLPILLLYLLVAVFVVPLWWHW
ncbi:MAG TPA: SLC13 family permease [Thermomicrobiales bacterium]|nr:SLC13 family permease [Thermomicrobiales bacterium]